MWQIVVVNIQVVKELHPRLDSKVKRRGSAALTNYLEWLMYGIKHVEN